MAAQKGIDYPTWRPRSKLTSEIQLRLCGSITALDKDLLAQKSLTITRILQKNPHCDVSYLLRDIPADEESMELVQRFCHGFEINLSTENVVRVACVADYLGMVDRHCPNNLLNIALSFLHQNVIPSWNNSIKALKTAESVFEQARQLGIVEYCIESIIIKALDDPSLLGEPIRITLSSDDDDDGDSDDEDRYRPKARRKLFDMDWKKSEDLTALSLRLYVPIINGMIERQVKIEYIAANICQYTKTWIFLCDKLGERDSEREMVEALITLLPNERDIFPCTFLCEMLRAAIAVDANGECKHALEVKIGMQLGQASVKDLLIPSQGYASDEKYDTECLTRILKNFCNNTSPNVGELNSIADLIDEFLAEISGDIDLKTRTFISVAELSIVISQETDRSSDGIYRAIDIYLDKHRHLIESEKEMLCKVLDCNRLSLEACEHVAKNERLPVRVVVQVLFVSQLKLREAIPREVVVRVGEEAEEGGVRTEMERMGSKVCELEREYCVMRREIERGGGVKRKKRTSVWKEMKRKFGCVTNTIHDCNCHVKKKKVHPR